MNGLGGIGGNQGARGGAKGGGDLLKKLFDPAGILPDALNPGTHLKMLAGGPLAPLMGGASPLKALLGGPKVG